MRFARGYPIPLGMNRKSKEDVVGSKQPVKGGLSLLSDSLRFQMMQNCAEVDPSRGGSFPKVSRLFVLFVRFIARIDQ